MTDSSGKNADARHLEVDLHGKPREKLGNLNYGGEISATDSWQLLQDNGNAVFVDVRTPQELINPGRPDLSRLNKQSINIPWKLPETFAVNPDFAAQLEVRLAEYGSDKSQPIIFMCKSGGRSLDAAVNMTALGYSNCLNLSDGFVGAPGSTSSWMACGLPVKMG
jgi:rhodanese-related sulfurtransferase